MFNKIVCFFFGHIFREKVFSGQTFEATTTLGTPIKGTCYTWEWLDRCPRCGQKIPTNPTT